jgi:hypothetical protein
LKAGGTDYVTCLFPLTAKSTVTSLREGQTVKIRGKCAGLVYGNFSLTDCTLVKWWRTVELVSAPCHGAYATVNESWRVSLLKSRNGESLCPDRNQARAPDQNHAAERPAIAVAAAPAGKKPKAAVNAAAALDATAGPKLPAPARQRPRRPDPAAEPI